ncbi:MAG: hypothetical protein ABI992_02310 [Chthoniobacterales bacterium]
MNRFHHVFFGAAFLAFTLQPARASAPERSVSSSRQFVVYGDDIRLRGAICDLAERTKNDTLQLLGARDDWKTPIVVDARAAVAGRSGAPVAELRVNQTGAGLKFQLELRLRAEPEAPEIEREVERAVLLEMMYRSRPDLPAGSSYVDPPDWLIEGLLALSPSKDATPLAQSLKTALAGRLITFEEFLRQKRALLDSPSQVLYRAYSAALVARLTQDSPTRVRLKQFVLDLNQASNNPMADLATRFPELGTDRTQMEERWRSAVTTLAKSERFRLLTCSETERRLAEMLRINVVVANESHVFSLEEASRFVRNPAAQPELQRMTMELLLLSSRAHPLYQPIVAQYQRIAARLLRRKIPKARELAELQATREDLNRRMESIADYMNWFEATQARATSGAFRNYLRAADEALTPVPRRRDPISVYLDALETQF